MGYEPKYDMTVYASAGMVRSASDGARAHRVQLPDCDCADFINRKGQLAEIDGQPVITICKHIAEFMARAGGWKRPSDPEPEVHSGLSRERARTILAEHNVPGGIATDLLNAAKIDGTIGEPGVVQVSYYSLSRRYDLAFPPVLL